MSFTKSLCTTVFALLISTSAQAGNQFKCDPIGDGAYTVILSEFDARIGWAIYLLEGDMAAMAGEEINGITLTEVIEGDDVYYDAVEAQVQFWPVESFGRLFADGEAVDCYPAPPGGL